MTTVAVGWADWGWGEVFGADHAVLDWRISKQNYRSNGDEQSVQSVTRHLHYLPTEDQPHWQVCLYPTS